MNRDCSQFTIRVSAPLLSGGCEVDWKEKETLLKQHGKEYDDVRMEGSAHNRIDGVSGGGQKREKYPGSGETL